MYESLFNSLVATIRSWIQDKIDSIHDHHEETLDARDETLGYRNDAATSASNAATSEANAAGAVQAAITDLVGQAPETLDTLAELADALGNDPNFATTVSNEIGLRAKTSDVNTALAGKSNTGHTHVKGEVGLGNVDNTSDANKPVSTATQTALNGKANSSHTHPVGDISATGTPSSTTYLNGAGAWSTPPNSTWANMTQEMADEGTVPNARVIGALVLRETIRKAAVSNATYGTSLTLWTGDQAAYDALPSGTKNAAGFVAIISG